jgi:hypothetical protein
MSLGSTLASRIANLFSPDSTHSNSQNHNSVGFVDDGISGGTGDFPDVKLGTANFRSNTMASEAVEEEEARPPYIHVSYYHIKRKAYC